MAAAAAGLDLGGVVAGAVATNAASKNNDAKVLATLDAEVTTWQGTRSRGAHLHELQLQVARVCRAPIVAPKAF